MTTCVEQMTCYPTKLMDVWKFYTYQYGIPDAVILGLFLGILVAGIYLYTRSLNILVILGVYVIAAVSATWANSSVAPAFQGIVWIIALAISSMVVIMIMKVTRE